jgi:hypothetical protein
MKISFSIKKQCTSIFKFLLLVLIHHSCFSQVTSNTAIDLSCKGTSSGTDVRSEYREFDLTVDTLTGEMYNYPNRVSIACMESSPKDTKTCTVGSNYIACQCKTFNSFATRGTMQLSRNTGKLKITTFFKDAVWEGDYSCEKVIAKKF